jgi:hypothetical protein
MTGRKRKNYVGMKFGRLTVTSFSHINKSLYYLNCECICGNTTTVATANLISGSITSCGCKAKENRLPDRRIARIYWSMINRCHNPNYKNYKWYGAKGISVCDEWRQNSKVFYDWALANGYHKNLELDREINTGNYSPDNCRWITHAENMRNTSQNVIITIDGISKCLTEWCRFLNLNYYRISDMRRRRKNYEAELQAEYNRLFKAVGC